MSISAMGQEGLLNIPTPQSGNLELLRKIADLENSISELKAKQSSIFYFGKTHVQDANDAPDGICTMDVYGQNNPFTYYCTLLTMKESESSTRAQQIALPIAAYESNYIAFRNKEGNEWGSWKKIWFSE